MKIGIFLNSSSPGLGLKARDLSLVPDPDRNLNQVSIVYVELELVWFLCSKSISSGAQYVTLPKYFSHPSFSLCTLLQSHLWNWDRDSREVGELLIANHLDQSIIMMGQSEILSSSQIIIYYTLFCKCRATATCTIVWSQNKPFCWAKPANIGFSSSNLTLHDHILYINSLRPCVRLWRSSGPSQTDDQARPSQAKTGLPSECLLVITFSK